MKKLVKSQSIISINSDLSTAILMHQIQWVHCPLVVFFCSEHFRRIRNLFLAHLYSKCSQPSSRKRLRLLGDMATPLVVWPWLWVLYAFILFSSFLCHDSFFQLERAFELIKQGLVTLDNEDKIDKKKTSLPQFNNKLWGLKVHKWVMLTQKLDVKEH